MMTSHCDSRLRTASTGAGLSLAPVLGLGLALGLGGCSSLPAPISLGSLPAADSMTAINPPTTVYMDIAQRALQCWVGPKGPLKETHIFHAEAASPTTGGKAEIVLHERDKTQPHPWGARTFRIELSGEGGGTNTRVTMSNIKMKQDLADAMRADVVAWADGKDSCQAQVVRPPPPEPPVTVAAAKPKAKAKKAQ